MFKNFLGHPVKDGMLARVGLARYDIVDRDPVWVIQVQGVEHYIADIVKRFIP